MLLTVDDENVKQLPPFSDIRSAPLDFLSFFSGILPSLLEETQHV